MAALRAGAASVIITPPVGVDLTGFASRLPPSTAIHDDLVAGALVLDDGQCTVALVTTDLLGLGFDLVEKIRGLVWSQVGIPASCLLLNSSHTHYGPATVDLRGLGDRDEPYVDVLVRSIAGAVKMAVDKLQAVSAGAGRGAVRIGVNRREQRPEGISLGRNPEGTVPSWVDVIRVDGNGGRPSAVLFSHSTHGVTLGGRYRQVSADFPGCARRFVEKWMGCDSGVAMFAQGCCGDINPETVGGTYDDTQRLGNILGAATVQAAERIQTASELKVGAAIRDLALPLQDSPPVVEAMGLLQKAKDRLRDDTSAGKDPVVLRNDDAMLQWANDLFRLSADGAKGLTQPFCVQGIRLGDVAIIGLSGEVFMDYALDLDMRSPFSQTIVLGCSNGCGGYVPDEEAFAEGGYEVTEACKYYGTLMIRPESDSMIRHAALDVLEELQGA